MAARTPTIDCQVYYYERNRSWASSARTVGDLDEVTGDDMATNLYHPSNQRSPMHPLHAMKRLTACPVVNAHHVGDLSSRFYTWVRTWIPHCPLCVTLEFPRDSPALQLFSQHFRPSCNRRSLSRGLCDVALELNEVMIFPVSIQSLLDLPAQPVDEFIDEGREC